MSIQEIVYRTKTQLEAWYEKNAFLRIGCTASPPPVVVESDCWISVPSGFQHERMYIEAADSILKGRLTVFRLNIDAYEVIKNWNKDPKTQTKAPMTFGKTIDCHDRSVVGDIKYLWEPNRHLHLTVLAQAFRLSNSDLYLKAIKLHLNSWLDQCPYLAGPNWCSSLEIAIRLINWSIVWQLIGGVNSVLFQDSDGEIFRAKWLSSIYQHMAFISKNFSLYSSANNHLIGEAAGLFVASTTWPYWSKVTEKWRGVGFELLVDEALKQSSGDGVGREQAIAYQQFVLDFLILSLLAGKAAGISFPNTYLIRIEKMMEFLGSMMDAKGNIPMIGDADDGYVVKLSQEPNFCPYRSLLACGGMLFQRTDFLQKAQRIDDKTRWLLGDTAEIISALPEKDFEMKRSFPEGGYFILGRDFGTSNEIKCIIDCGPIGYLSIAAHGHADALALYLSVGGTELLIDPGTFSYHEEDEWRAYFRGTSAHNTVRIDQTDQSLSGGKFMWLHKANVGVATVEFASDRDEFEGSHDGYLRLRDPVIHRRKLIFNKMHNILSILDTIECSKDHIVERFWHFHEKCKVNLSGNMVIAENNGSKIRLMTNNDDSQLLICRGDEVLPQGWVSRRYDEKVPAVTVVVKNIIKQTTSLRTDIQISIDRANANHRSISKYMASN